MKPIKYQINGPHGALDVTGNPIGKFLAVRKVVDGRQSYECPIGTYIIDHLPTGMAIAVDLPRKLATDTARILSEFINWDWGFADDRQNVDITKMGEAQYKVVSGFLRQVVSNWRNLGKRVDVEKTWWHTVEYNNAEHLFSKREPCSK